MSFWDFKDAPPYVVSTGKALSLRAKTVEAARARIDNLLATARDVVCFESALGVKEPVAGRRFAPMDAAVSIGSGPRDDLPRLVERAGHTLSAGAQQAWDRFGPPRYVQLERDATTWEWRELDEKTVYEFARDHASEGGRADLRFRFRLCGDPYPASEIHAWLIDGKSTAYFNVVLPHVAATREFFADVDKISAAVGMKIAPNRFMVSHASASGNRVFRKMQLLQ